MNAVTRHKLRSLLPALMGAVLSVAANGPCDTTDSATTSVTAGTQTAPLSAAPVLFSIIPNAGVYTTSTPVTITGTGFAPGVTVMIGAAPCGSVGFVSSTQLVCTVPPAAAAGPATVIVQNLDNQAAVLSNAFTYLGAPISPLASTISGTTSVTADGVSISTVTIKLIDTTGAGVVGLIPTFSATNTGSTNLYGPCTATGVGGVATCTLKSTHAELKTLSITSPISLPGGTVTFVAGPPVAANSGVFFAPGPITAGSFATVFLGLYDAFNNPVSGVVPTFTATDTGGTNVYGLCSATSTSGSSTCTFNSAKAETKIVQMVTPVAGSITSSVTYNPAAASGPNSTIIASGPVTADGSATSTVTIQLKDQYNNLINSGTVNYSVSGAGSFYVTPCAYQSVSNAFQCRFSSFTTGVKNLAVIVPAMSSPPATTATFVPGPASAANSSVISNLGGGGSWTADGSSIATVSVLLKDAAGNVITGVAPTVSATDQNGTNQYLGCTPTNSSGYSQCSMRTLSYGPSPGPSYIFKTWSLTSPVLVTTPPVSDSFLQVPQTGVPPAPGFTFNPAAGPLTSIKKIVSGVGFTCALMADGTITCWGRNDFGQLGVGDTNAHSTSVKVSMLPGETAADISAGAFHACYVNTSGYVACWGLNSNGQLGTNDIAIHSKPDTFVKTADSFTITGGNTGAGSNTITGVTSFAGVLVGATVRGLATPGFVPANTIITSFNSGGGSISLNQQATGVTTVTLVLPPLVDVVSVSAGYDHTCVLRGDGAIGCWGNQESGKLGNYLTSGYQTVSPKDNGDSTTCSSSSPGNCWQYDPGYLGYIAVAAGRHHTCGLVSNGTVNCWGGNANGQIGINSTADPQLGIQTVFKDSGGTNLAGVTSIATHPLANHTCAVLDNGQLKCWGQGGSGQLGNLANADSPVPAFVQVPGPSNLTGVKNVTVGAAHTCALQADSTLSCWGSNIETQARNSATTSFNTPMTIFAPGGPFGPFKSVSRNALPIGISAGDQHTCALGDDASAVCWGYNFAGQLGGSSSSVTSPPLLVQDSGSAGSLNRVKQIVAGQTHACALYADGTVKCWGGNNHGQLGNNSTTFTTSATPVSTLSTPSQALKGVVSLSAGQEHTCALRSSGDIWCWGRDQENEYINSGSAGIAPCGSDNVKCAIMAIATGLPTPAVAVASGIDAQHTCALMGSANIAQFGTAQCMGNNNMGQIGNGVFGPTGSVTVPTNPVSVVSNTPGKPPLSGIKALSLSQDHSCALLSDGSARCWGNDSTGQLGDHNPILLGSTCSLAAASPSVTNCQTQDGASVTSALVGQFVLATNVPANTTVQNVSGGTITLSANASGTQNPQMMAVSPGLTLTNCTVTGASPTVTGCLTPDNQPLSTLVAGQLTVLNGQTVSGPNIPAGTTISSINGAGAITLSVNASGSSSPTQQLAVSNWLTLGSCVVNNTTLVAGCAPSVSVTSSLVGALVVGTNILFDTTVAAVDNVGNITLSKAAAGPAGGAAGSLTFALAVQPYPVVVRRNSGSSTTSLSPLLSISTLSAGVDHTCASVAWGATKCWGNTASGQIGDGVTTGAQATWDYVTTNEAANASLGTGANPMMGTALSPNTWMGFPVSVTSGNQFSCSIIRTDRPTTSGTSYGASLACWGLSSRNQLGNNSTTNSSRAKTVSFGSSKVANYLSATAGDLSACALTATGSVQCWGDNTSGQLGTGDFVMYAKPTDSLP